MRFFLAALAIALFTVPALADEVPLEQSGGTYTVPVTINGAVKIKFTIDSGAADVLIPADVALTLARSGTLAESDFIGNKTYSLADGSTLQSVNFYLREVRVGNQIVRNVVASVGPGISQPLLGQSFLSRIGAWTLDNNRHVLVLNPPPGAAPPQATIPEPSKAPTKWEDLTKKQAHDFFNQCYVQARTAALRGHKRFCMQDIREHLVWLSLRGTAMVVDTMEENTPVSTQNIAFTCYLQWDGQTVLSNMNNDGSPFLKEWATGSKNCMNSESIDSVEFLSDHSK